MTKIKRLRKLIKFVNTRITWEYILSRKIMGYIISDIIRVSTFCRSNCKINIYYFFLPLLKKHLATQLRYHDEIL